MLYKASRLQKQGQATSSRDLTVVLLRNSCNACLMDGAAPVPTRQPVKLVVLPSGIFGSRLMGYSAPLTHGADVNSGTGKQ
jgi:hypothetical protein